MAEAFFLVHQDVNNADLNSNIFQAAVSQIPSIPEKVYIEGMDTLNHLPCVSSFPMRPDIRGGEGRMLEKEQKRRSWW